MKLSLEKLHKSYGEKVVLRDFSLSLPESGVIALLGPSGCGKTTLLRLIAGLEKPEGGAVSLQPDAKLSMVFQEDRLLDSVGVRGNVLAVLPRGKNELAELCLARVGLAEAANQYPPALSGGMKRRLAVARAMAFGGDLLLLDEPLKGLDDDTKQQVAAFIFDHREWPVLPPSGERLCLFVTHDWREALAWADEILVLEGPPLHLRSRVEGGPGTLPQREEKLRALFNTFI